MMSIKQLILLFFASIFVFVEGNIIQCSKETPQVNIHLVGTVIGSHTRYFQLNIGYDIGNMVCYEIGKKLRYNTVCSYGNKSHNCQCSGSWTNDKGLNNRINEANKILKSGQLVECVM